MIYRSKPTQSFLTLPNETVQDGRLSMKASGLLHYMLSLPVDWGFNVAHLTKHFIKDGETAIRTGLDELEEIGYLVRKQARTKNGKFSGQDWKVVDTPAFLPDKEKPNADNPEPENPDAEKPNADNQGLQKTQGTKDTGTNNTEYKRQNEQTNSNESNKVKDQNNNVESTKDSNRSFDSFFDNLGNDSNNNDIHKALAFYQNNVGTISPFQMEQLQAYANDFSSDMIIEAIKVALNKNIRNIKFITGVLNTWHKKNVHTLEEKKADDLEHKKQYSNNSNNDTKDNTNGGIIEHENGDIEF